MSPNTPLPEAGGLPVMRFASGEAWRAWLEQDHASSPGVWLQIAKKGATKARRLRQFVEMLERGEKLHP